jgi:drug/metabolite transporter (DMT)-like permease
VVLLSFVVFAEIPPVLAIIGGVICLVGVALSRRKTAVATSPTAAARPGGNG